jgi:cytochrome P450
MEVLMQSHTKTPPVNKSNTKRESLCTRYTLNTLSFFNKTVLPSLFKVADLQFPVDSFLPGNPFWGKAGEMFSDDGLGIDRILMQGAAPVAINNAAGIAHWRFGPTKTVVLITKPSDIQEVISTNQKNLHLHDSTGSFKLFFGEHSIFNSAYQSPNWKHLRSRFLNALFSKASLNKNIEKMQAIADRLIDSVAEQNYQINNLEQFANSVAMDMICITKLGFKSIDEEVKSRISAVISKASIAVANPTNQLIDEYLPFAKYFYTSELKKLLNEGFDILRHDVIKPNEESIRTTPNWLNENGEKTEFDLYSQSVVYDVTQFLVAGHETTAKLILMSLLLLGDSNHADILSKLTAEITSKQTQPQDWQHDDLEQLPYLNAFLKEVLRLYPPVPDMVFKVASPFKVCEGSVKKDDLIVISPRITHTLKSVWGEDAHLCKPERMLQKTIDAYQYFAFGFAPKPCPGQKFAFEEAALILSRLLSVFKPAHDLHHPFPCHQIFTLRIDLENIKMNFIPRDQRVHSKEVNSPTLRC